MKKQENWKRKNFESKITKQILDGYWMFRLYDIKF